VLIYRDSVVLIYFLDASDAFHQKAAARLTALGSAGDELAVSDLTRLECRVKPLQTADAKRLAVFDGFFALPDVRKAPLTAGVYDRAALLRARFAFKTIDAIHLAASVESGCDRFLTQDHRLTRCTDITVELLT
jgi:predicted nucleic acid-binding protein